MRWIRSPLKLSKIRRESNLPKSHSIERSGDPKPDSLCFYTYCSTHCSHI